MTPEQLAAYLTGLALQRIDFGPVAQVARVYLAAQSKRCIAESRSPDGVAYAPLKRRKGKPLWHTGVMVAGLGAVSQTFANGFSATQTVGTDYSLAQNFGFTARVPEKKRKKPWVWKDAKGLTVFARKIRAHTVTVPARRFLGISDPMAGRVEQLAVDAVTKQLAG